MSWLSIALLGYFLLAFSFVLDKALLKRRIPRPAVYAFYVAILSLVSITLIPFGVQWLGWKFFLTSIFSGILFIWALLFYYYAVKENEISKIAPLVGTIVQITTFVVGVLFLKNVFYPENLWGIMLLIVGGFLVSFDLPLKYKNILRGFKFSLLSGVMLGIAYTIFDGIYKEYRVVYGDEGVFVNGFFWTRLGLVCGGLSLLLHKEYRQSIKNSIFGKEKKYQKRRDLKTVFFFVLNKVFGGSSSILINYAIMLGGATKVQAISSAQFVFVLILASLMMIKYPDIFEEKLFFWDWAQKIVSIGLITLGIWLIYI